MEYPDIDSMDLDALDDPKKTRAMRLMDLKRAYMDRMAAYKKKLQPQQNVMYSAKDPDEYITLSSGKFRGAKVPKKLIDDVMDSANRNKANPFLLLGLIGQESTFANNNDRQLSRTHLVSGWNLGRQYEPKDISMFLADQKAPGVELTKNNHGYFAKLKDEQAVDEWLSKNPKMAQAYLNMLGKTKEVPDNYNVFDDALSWLMNRGIKSYNPGDRNYESDVRQSISLLKSDPVLNKYIRTKKK